MKKIYSMPSVRVVKVNVERGYAASAAGDANIKNLRSGGDGSANSIWGGSSK